VRRRRRTRPAVVLLLLALGLVAVSQYVLSTRPPQKDPAGRLLYLPNGRFLRVASLGYPTFLADLIYLWSIQHYGTYREQDRFLYLEKVYGEVIAGLDPRYVEPYLIGALILVVEKRDVQAGLRLLDQGMEANPDEWILPYEAGFWAYDTASDYDLAARYFKRTMEIPGAPPSARRLYAEMFNKQGDKETSLALWREVLESAGDQKVLAIAANHVHDLTLETDLMRIQAAIDAFRQAAGANPPELASLVRTGHLQEVPLDPDGNSYEYDSRTGEVRPVVQFRLRRR
jgi:tetratricopeptide (TPR) repeat protein